MTELPVGTVVAVLAFLAGLAFGATAQRTNFCTMGAISDMVYLQDWRRFRAWLLAIAVALLGSQALYIAGAIDLAKSIYLTPNFGWLGAILGGLMFGFGMTFTGGCGNKTLVRIGAGNMKSLVVAIVLGIFAYMTLRGLIGLGRVNVIERANVNLQALGSQGVPEILGRMGVPGARWIVGLGLAAILLWFCFKDESFRRSPTNIAAGVIIGALIPAGWLITGVAGADDFDPTPLASFTFVAPIGDSLMYLMLFTGTSINFGIAAVGGVIAGAFAMALATGAFKFEGFTAIDDMQRHLIGAALMGTGGVLSLGCTIGQGITGLSTLAAGSFLAFASIVAGGIYGMKYLEEGAFGGALRAMFTRAPA
jgi:uncharacterized protein